MRPLLNGGTLARRPDTFARTAWGDCGVIEPMSGLTVICCGVAGLATLLIVLNWVGFLAFAFNHRGEGARSGYSFTPPFICGPVLAAVWALCPTFPFRPYAWIAVPADPSILLVLLALVLGVFGKVFRRHRGSGEG